MSDKEIVFQAINKYAKDLASNLFHLIAWQVKLLSHT